MPRKPAAQPTKEPTLKQLQERRSYLEESVAVGQLEAKRKLLESFSWYFDDWPSTDLWEKTRGRQAWSNLPPSTPSDRRSGANWPLWRTEQELDLLRQRSRVLVQTNSFAEGLLNNLTNYTLGHGCTYKAQSKRRVDANPAKPGVQEPADLQALVAETQQWLDAHNQANRWNCVGDPFSTQPQALTREKESCNRTRRDGEAFLRLFHAEDGSTAIRFIEPELIRNPSGAGPGGGWSYGIKHHVDEHGREDVEQIVAYNVRYPNGEEEEVPAIEIVHIRNVNTDCTIKRGAPSFAYDTLAALERASKLQKNTSVGAAVRAATAEIWEHEIGTQAQLTALAAGLATSQTTDPNTGRTVNIEDIRPGTVRRVPQGQKLVTREETSATPAHLQAVQGDLRQASTAFSAPEYMTGDASNANYASTREAGTPFVLARESDQGHFTGAFSTVVMRCLRHAVQCGRLPANTLDLVEVQVEAPAIKQRDPLQKTQEDQILGQIGKSPQTTLMEHGLDPEMEAANTQEWRDRFGSPGMALPMPEDLAPSPARLPSLESRELARLVAVLESWDESKHSRDHGKFASKSGGKDATTDDHPDHAAAGEIATSKTLWQRIRGLPKAIVRKSVDFSRNLYRKAEAKYGPRWAKAILATAIVTMPTPFTMGSVAAMTGLAHLWTKYVSRGQAGTASVKESRETEPSPEAIEAMAKEWVKQLLAAFGQAKGE